MIKILLGRKIDKEMEIMGFIDITDDYTRILDDHFRNYIELGYSYYDIEDAMIESLSKYYYVQFYNHEAYVVDIEAMEEWLEICMDIFYDEEWDREMFLDYREEIIVQMESGNKRRDL